MNLTEALDGAPTRDDLVVAGGDRLSTSELEAATSSVAAALASRSVGRGDRVAFQLPVSVDAVVLYRACWRLGAVAAALHPRAGPTQLVAALEVLNPAVLVAGSSSPAAELADVLDASSLRGSGEVPPVFVAPSDDALVMFTSGSSGAPKGVVHTHGGLLYKVRQLLEVHSLGPEDVILMPAPLAHVSGLLHGILVPGVAGMRTVLMPRWDPADALGLIEAEAVTYMVGPPTFFLALMDDPAFSPERTRSLRMLSCGGADVTPAFVERARNELGAVVKRSYGSTEAPTVATSRFDDPPER
ncbi:MAG: AMP-binding protein, partial [Acidimicrobiales bacterium]|nr:AMP-binding protein [Acidimicrobiales bacterium]